MPWTVAQWRGGWRDQRVRNRTKPSTASPRCAWRALLEFALVFPLLAMLVLGTIDVGRAFLTWNEAKNAAREGAAYAQLYPNRPVPAAGECADPENIRYHAQAESGTDFAITTRRVRCLAPCHPWRVPSPSSPAAVGPGAEVTVRATRSFAPLTPFIDLARSPPRSPSWCRDEAPARGIRRAGRHHRGARVVFPIFAAMILALVHFGLVEASDSSASNAAREGARVGIFEYLAADVEGSDSRTAIEAAVTARLGGLVASPSVAVRCQHPSGGGVTTVPCSSAIVLGRDMIEVTVTWSSVSPIGQETRTTRAQMVIIGRPDLTDIVPPSTTTTTTTP